MDEVQITRDGPVATVTLNRPEVKNAATPEMWDVLREAFREVGYDEAVRVIVVTGAGGEFCSGADVSGFGQRDAAPGMESMRRVGEAVMALH
ncbi:MAG: enoyl-CoA hydratase/isomerase family protein, partial [Acidimicrobiia bacterium]|nr:enoyl-CoA hydratase/isomerase family protein [Acidimicrobiia bacterium]